MLVLRRLFANSFTSGVCSLVGPGKEKGEDAYFTSNDLISIADGVGGWTLSGVDPSKYAWQLMNNVQKFSASLASDRTSFNILYKAAEDSKEIGSSTCSLLLLSQNQPVLDAINIGDSGFFIYRQHENELVLIDKSQDVLHDFNFPYQLGTNGDPVKSGWTKTITIADKDIIIMYTDGLSDNLFENMIRDIVKKEIENEFVPVKIAEKLANTALEFSGNNRYISPFAKAAGTSFGQRYIGGKPDDITVIVSQIHLDKK